MALGRNLFFSLIVLFSLSFSCVPAAASPPKKVALALYYETLCPYSANFIVNYLAKIFSNGLIDIVDLNLVPYGNARLKSNHTITCQHGPNECLLNTIEACAIYAWPDLNKHFAFIYCVESLVVEHKYSKWESCFEKTGLDSQSVADCFNSGYGEKLELQYAEETNALEPPHTYVPWVVVDGQPLYEDYENFETYICKAYKGNLPKACSELPLAIIQEKKAVLFNRVCHAKRRMHLIRHHTGMKRLV
ncbi:gamma-interferon-responsive lysosomal thiol protein isoform X2 [Magnolia sinica]|uniref:gamma-interferon-responsive lysosomal thiol protein isoform X2 n=1 Tax=Magnolia sinica TaxID=86752 RepID=UPI00265929A2|nr:gamma-interferon-responsive lysosomal thiol protein isoform X2 [Magnolia sinica]